MTCKIPRAARRTWALPAVIALCLGCDEGQGCGSTGCEACEEAIAHMTAKIEGFGCNPTFMENAVERIQDDCEDFDEQRILGAIVEECSVGEGIAVGCYVRDVNFRVDFFVDPTFTAYPDGVDIHLSLDDSNLDTQSPAPNGEFPLGEGESIAWIEEIKVDSTLHVTITDPADPENEIAYGSEQLVVREGPQYWGNTPFRSAVLTESADGLPIVEFYDF